MHVRISRDVLQGVVCSTPEQLADDNLGNCMLQCKQINLNEGDTY